LIGWGEFFALAASFCWAFSVILLRKPGLVLPAFELNLFRIVFAVLLLIPTILVMEGWSWPYYSAGELGIVFFSGYIGIAVADTWFLRALNLMGASRTGIVASLFSPFVIILSIFFLGESLRVWQICGFVLVMGGILLVTWQRSRQEADSQHIHRGVMYGVGSVFLMAVGVVMVKGILETRPFIWTVQLRLLGGLAGMVIYIALRGQRLQVARSFTRSLPWAPIVAGSFLGSYLSMILWLAGYKLIPASVASILNESANAWIVLLAWLILHESLGLRKMTGLFMTISGVIIMVLV
jgi:drug/metabolite transporter (DMT)-like permease